MDQDQHIHLLSGEVDWYRQKVTATADALDRLGEKATAAGKPGAAWAFSEAANLVRDINEMDESGGY